MSGLLSRVFRWALLLHPKDFRRTYGDELTAVFRSGLDQRRSGRLSWGARAILDAAWAGLRARLGTPRPPRGLGRLGSGGASGAWSGLRRAVRSLVRSPGFSVGAILILALGVGANTAVFSAIRTVLLAPSPFPDAERLVLVDLSDSSRVEPGPPRAAAWSYPKYRILEASVTGLSPLAAFARRSLTLTGAGDPLRMTVEVVTPSYHDVLGAIPVEGRTFAPPDDAPDSEAVVILGHGLWTTRFGGDPDLVGRTVRLDGHAATVVGIAPPGFRGLTGSAEAWVPVHTYSAMTVPFLVSGAEAHWLRAVARLPVGAAVGPVSQELRAIGRRIDEAHPRQDSDVLSVGTLQSLQEARVSREARQALMVLMVTSGLLLLTACANLAGLFAARAARREREMDVRRALGAGRRHIAGAFLTESLLLSLVGSLAAAGVAKAGVALLSAVWPARFAEASWNVGFVRPEAMTVDLPILGYALAASLACGLAFGVVPALARGGGRRGLGLGAREAVGRTPGLRLRGGLVAAEVAFAVVLVVGAGLLLRSLRELGEVPRGYQSGDLVAFVATPPMSNSEWEPVATFELAALERFAALPGVESASVTCALPLGGHCWIGEVRGAGSQRWDFGDRPRAGINPVGDHFFRTLGIELQRGRVFDRRDQEESLPVAVLSASAAEELFGGADPLGRSVELSASLTPEGGPGATVIGVVADVLYDRPEQGTIPEIYLSHRQEAGAGTFLIRAAGEPVSVLPAVRAALADLDPDVPVYAVRTLEELEAESMGDTRTLGGLLAVFAGLALALAVTGVWAVVSYGVTRRTRELGLRMALGARRDQVAGLVIREDLAPVLAGLLVGLAVAWGASRLLESLLYGVAARDPLTFLGTVAVLLGAGLGAAWIPARRATRLQPLDALRVD